MSYKVTVSL